MALSRRGGSGHPQPGRLSVVAGGRERRRVYGVQGFEAVRDRHCHRPREVAFRRRRKLGDELSRGGARKGDLRHVGFQPLCRAGCRDRQGARPAAREGLCVLVAFGGGQHGLRRRAQRHAGGARSRQRKGAVGV